jgi:hypothetical protein
MEEDTKMEIDTEDEMKVNTETKREVNKGMEMKLGS